MEQHPDLELARRAAAGFLTPFLRLYALATIDDRSPPHDEQSVSKMFSYLLATLSLSSTISSLGLFDQLLS